MAINDCIQSMVNARYVGLPFVHANGEITASHLDEFKESYPQGAYTQGTSPQTLVSICSQTLLVEQSVLCEGSVIQ